MQDLTSSDVCLFPGPSSNRTTAFKSGADAGTIVAMTLVVRAIQFWVGWGVTIFSRRAC